MKTIFKTIIGSLSIAALSACSDFLDQTSPSELTSDVAFESTYYTEQILNRCYGQMGQDNAYTTFITIHMGMNTDCELIGNALGESNSMDGTREKGNMNYNCNSEWKRLSEGWTILYGIIETANSVIEGIEKSSIAQGNSAEAQTMQRFKGEALAIRAMIYFDLIRTWGDVPMKMESSKPDLSNAYLNKTDRDVIMDRLLDDLDQAIELLPWAGEKNYTTERMNKGYAHALLANIALTRAGWAIRESAKEGYITATINSDPTYPTQRCDDSTRKKLYERALKHLSAVISNPTHQLNPSFAQEWELINQCKLDLTYRENLFEIPMGIGATGELGYTTGVKTNGPIKNFYNTKNNASTLQLTSTLLYSFNEKDTRRDITCSAVNLTEKDEKLAEEFGLKNSPFQIHCGKWDVRKMSKEYRDMALAKGPQQKTPTGINPVRMRYSQVLLMYAEVMNELAGADGSYNESAEMTARQALAEVHSRAYEAADKEIAEAYINTIPADRESFFRAIVDENKWELAGEGLRKYDLIRWNLLSSEIDRFKATYLQQIENGTYPEKIYYNYTDDTKLKIDLNSITWNGLPEDKTEADYDGSADFFGKEKNDEKKTQSQTNLPYISAGLNKQVKNRYIMPLGHITVSSSNGALKNSYGY